MRTAFFIFVFIFLSPTLSLAGNRVGSLDDIARTLSTYFPKVTGTIRDVGAERVTLVLPEGEQLVPGVLLSVYREDEPFYHPETGVLLGRYETEKALLEVLATTSPEVVARPVDVKEPLVSGDLVRLTRARIPLSLSAQKGDEGWMQEFREALHDTGRFEVEASDSRKTVSPFYHVTFETTPPAEENTAPSVHLRLQNVTTDTVLVDVHVDLAPVAASDFMIESLQQLHRKKYQTD